MTALTEAVPVANDDNIIRTEIMKNLTDGMPRLGGASVAILVKNNMQHAAVYLDAVLSAAVALARA